MPTPQSIAPRPTLRSRRPCKQLRPAEFLASPVQPTRPLSFLHFSSKHSSVQITIPSAHPSFSIPPKVSPHSETGLCSSQLFARPPHSPPGHPQKYTHPRSAESHSTPSEKSLHPASESPHNTN